MPTPSRRRFFKLALLGLAGIAGGGVLLRRWLEQPPALPAELAALRAALPPLPDADLIADAYLRQVPEEADPETLRRALLTDMPGGIGAAAELRAAIDAAIRADYAAARTQPIHNWVISRTEARLCVLSGRAS